jgi:hypothetical protein
MEVAEAPHQPAEARQAVQEAGSARLLRPQDEERRVQALHQAPKALELRPAKAQLLGGGQQASPVSLRLVLQRRAQVVRPAAVLVEPSARQVSRLV